MESGWNVWVVASGCGEQEVGVASGSGWNLWVWLVGVVSRRWVWLVGVGGIYGCGCKEVYRFPHTTYPYSSCICTFLQQHPYFFVHFLKCFSFLFQSFFFIIFYVYIK